MVAFLEFLVMFVIPVVRSSVVNWLWPKPISSNHLYVPAGSVLDLCLSKRELMMENALLRQQLIALRQQVKRPQLTATDRILLVLLASKLRAWKSAP